MAQNTPAGRQTQSTHAYVDNMRRLDRREKTIDKIFICVAVVMVVTLVIVLL